MSASTPAAHVTPSRTLTALLLLSTTLHAQEPRQKAAEGAFSVIANGREGEFRRYFDQWVLWKTAGGYELETTMYLLGRPQTSPAKQILYLSNQFHTEGFKIFPVPWDPPLVGSYDCHLQPLQYGQRLQCHYSIHNKQGAGTSRYQRLICSKSRWTQSMNTRSSTF